MKLLTTMVNCFKCQRTFLLILLFVGTQGDTETQCEATEGMILNCKFPENMESTETDFLIYFYSDDGKTELLADCSWHNNQLLCISQDGVQLHQPVSDKAVFSLSQRVVSKPGTYKCIPDGANSENSKACRFHKSQKEGKESKDRVQLQKKLPEKHHDQKGAEMSTVVIFGAVIASVAATIVIISVLVFLWKKKSKSSSSLDKQKRGEPTENKTTDTVSETQQDNGSQPVPLKQQSSAPEPGENNLLLESEKNENVAIREDASHEEKLGEPTENKTTDTVSDTQLDNGSQPVTLQQQSSAEGHEENKPLLQSENNTNVAIREDASYEEYSDTSRSFLELNDRSGKGFLRENNRKNERF